MEAAESVFECLEQVPDARRARGGSDIPFKPFCV